jgi:hypothetical protein
MLIRNRAFKKKFLRRILRLGRGVALGKRKESSEEIEAKEISGVCRILLNDY